MKYDPLFAPISIGPLTLKNRFVMAPMSVHMSENGSVTDAEIAYTARRAEGGAAMLIIGSLCVWPDGNFGGQLFIEDDARIPGLRRLTDAAHQHGSLIAAQIHHAGRETNAATSGHQPVAPSYFEPEVYSVFRAEYDPPRVLSTDEVAVYVERYAQAVRRAKEAGFDACELHCAHGYLICAFMSPLTNKRTDKYGGSFPARMCFVDEILQRSRELVGPDYPITCRIVGDELRDGGIDMELSVQIAQHLEKRGVAALSVSAGMYPYVRTVANMYHKRGVNLYLAENVRESVSIPVMAAGQLNRPEIQLRALTTGKADIICIGRALIADPDYPNKLKEGREDEIIGCIACNKGCHDRTSDERHIKCGLNVQTGRESKPDFVIEPAPQRKKVLVVGGGPAGLEAARVAALRGHEVLLYEKDTQLGGRLRLAALPPHKHGYAEACDTLRRAVGRLPISVHTGVEVTPNLLAKLKPDAVILASGTVPFIPPVPGLDSPIVVLADDVLTGAVTLGEHVAVIGGGSVGAETAHFLMEQAKRHVHVLEMRDGIGIDLPQDSRIRLLDALSTMPDLSCRCGVKVIGVQGRALTLESNGKQETLENLDNVVLAMGARPNQSLLEHIRALGIPVALAGDAEKPGDYVRAILRGFQTAQLV